MNMDLKTVSTFYEDIAAKQIKLQIVYQFDKIKSIYLQ